MATGRGTVFNSILTVAQPLGTLIVDTTNYLLFVSQSSSTADYECVSAPLFTELADPGTGVAIPVTKSASFSLAIGAGAETNTLADPTYAGQELSLICTTVGGGTRAVTAASDINQATNTVMTFAAAVDWINLVGVNVGTIAVPDLRWRVRSNDGVALS